MLDIQNGQKCLMWRFLTAAIILLETITIYINYMPNISSDAMFTDVLNLVNTNKSYRAL